MVLPKRQSSNHNYVHHWCTLVCFAIAVFIIYDLYFTDDPDSEPVWIPINECGLTWSDYYSKLRYPSNFGEIIMWTVAGGEEYRRMAPMLLKKWKSMDLHPVLVVCLDAETASSVCAAGYTAVHWEQPKKSYSRVADAKFEVAAKFAEQHYWGFFIELDVFCSNNPLPLFEAHSQNDIVEIGHGDISFLPNIGMWLTSPRVAPFFRGISKLLSYSLANPNYTNWYGNEKHFFDQEIMYACQEISTDDARKLSLMRFAVYERTDKNMTHNLMQYCNKTRPKIKILDHSYVSAHMPPIVYDTTECVHPLMRQPFAPLVYKMAVAKFLGFDPQLRPSHERLLKLESGDLTYSDCFNKAFSYSQVPENPTYQDMIRYHIATLLELANLSGRTLVLPRYLRDKDAMGVPLMSVVDTATIDIPWRILSTEEVRKIPVDENAVIEIPELYGLDTFMKLIRAQNGTRVVSLKTFCNVEAGRMDSLIVQRIKSLKYCIHSPNLRFTPSVGGWDELCMR